VVCGSLAAAVANGSHLTFSFLIIFFVGGVIEHQPAAAGWPAMNIIKWIIAGLTSPGHRNSTVSERNPSSITPWLATAEPDQLASPNVNTLARSGIGGQTWAVEIPHGSPVPNGIAEPNESVRPDALSRASVPRSVVSNVTKTTVRLRVNSSMTVSAS
jgi:hypothetical protein